MERAASCALLYLAQFLLETCNDMLGLGLDEACMNNLLTALLVLMLCILIISFLPFTQLR